jgi:hypothetical protein
MLDILYLGDWNSRLSHSSPEQIIFIFWVFSIVIFPLIDEGNSWF